MSAEQDWYAFLSEFRGASSNLASLLSHVAAPSSATLDAQRRALQQCQQVVDETTTLLTNVEPELRHYPYALRAKATQQLNECRDQFDAQQQVFRRFSQIARSNRLITRDDANNSGVGSSTSSPSSSSSFSSSSSSSSASSSSSTSRYNHSEQRAMLLDSRDTLSEADASLDNTQRMLYETQEIGAATSVKLVMQREQLVRARDTVDETDQSLRRSTKTIRRLGRRVLGNKFVSLAIILVLMAIFAFIAYFKYFR